MQARAPHSEVTGFQRRLKSVLCGVYTPSPIKRDSNAKSLFYKTEYPLSHNKNTPSSGETSVDGFYKYIMCRYSIYIYRCLVNIQCENSNNIDWNSFWPFCPDNIRWRSSFSSPPIPNLFFFVLVAWIAYLGLTWNTRPEN